MDLDGSMNWGIPLINAEYSIEQILNQFDNMKYVSTDPNGNFRFDFKTSKQEYLNIMDYNSIDNASYDFSLQFPTFELSKTFPGISVDFATENMRIIETTLKSGQIKFDLSNVSPPYSTDYNITITSSTVMNADGSPFVKELSKSNPVGYSDCAGLVIKTKNSQLNFDVKITMTHAPSTNLTFNLHISLLNIALKSGDVEVLKNQDLNLVASSSFAIFAKDPNLQAIVHNPELSLEVVNTFGCSINVIITDAYVQGDSHTESILLLENAPIDIEPNFTGSVNITQYIKRDILITSNYHSLYFEYTVLIPEGKRIQFFDFSKAEAIMNLSVPFDITIQNAVFSDTLAFGISGLSDLTILDTVKIRTAFSSSIPTDFSAQITLFDSKSNKIFSPLFAKPFLIKGSYTGVSIPSEIQYVIITHERIKEFQQADKLILSLSLNTEGTHYPFNEKNSLKAKVGAHIITATEF